MASLILFCTALFVFAPAHSSDLSKFAAHPTSTLNAHHQDSQFNAIHHDPPSKSRNVSQFNAQHDSQFNAHLEPRFDAREETATTISTAIGTVTATNANFALEPFEPDWLNGVGGSFDFECPKGEAITEIRSIYAFIYYMQYIHRDRKWSFKVMG